MKAWFEFLSTQTIQPLQSNNALCALNDTGLLYVGGDDATDFLQNQLSNDIRSLTPEHSHLSAFSSAKGRMHGIFRVIQIEGGYLLLMPKSILADIQQKLHRYILMSKVILADISESFASFSFTSDLPGLLDNPVLPAEPGQVYQSDSLISLRLTATNGRQRFMLLSNQADEAITLWSQLASQLTINDQDHWRLQEIEAGIPTVYPQTQEAFVIQMSNLQLLDGVSFKKGCYPGQEVVARMQYLGKLKRRMYLAELDCSDCPQPGDDLVTAGADTVDGSGKVVDAVRLADSTHCRMLYIAQIDKAESDQLRLAAQPQASIKRLSLPYSFVD